MRVGENHALAREPVDCEGVALEAMNGRRAQHPHADRTRVRTPSREGPRLVIDQRDVLCRNSASLAQDGCEMHAMRPGTDESPVEMRNQRRSESNVDLEY